MRAVFAYFRLHLTLAGMILLCLLTNCSGDSSRQVREREYTIDLPSGAIEDIVRVRKIFYSLPSPLETAMILRSSGGVYDEDLLNPVENSSRYLTNKSMALNLGIYITNLSYASLYNQSQTCLDYMEASRRLADNLGILEAIDNYTLERLEENINNRDIIMDIISESFMNSSSYLQENNREPVAAMLLVGGFVEGLYLALNQIDEERLAGNRLLDIVADKKLSLDIVMKLLEDNNDNSDIEQLIDEMDGLNKIFGRIERLSEPVVVTEGEDGVAVLISRTESVITRELFIELRDEVNNLRNSFVS